MESRKPIKKGGHTQLSGGGLRALLRSPLMPIGLHRLQFVYDGKAGTKATVTILAVPEHPDQTSAHGLSAGLRVALENCFVRFLARQAHRFGPSCGLVLWDWSASLDALTYRSIEQPVPFRRTKDCVAWPSAQPP
jgi:hypothetical protein